MKDLTYDDWKLNGRHVIRGEVSTKRNKQGEPVFSYEQTEPSYERDDNDGGYDARQDFYCGD
jgi:hypothetical protein